MSLRARLRRLESRTRGASSVAAMDAAVFGFLRILEEDPAAALAEAKSWSASSPAEAQVNAEVIRLLEVA